MIYRLPILISRFPLHCYILELHHALLPGVVPTFHTTIDTRFSLPVPVATRPRTSLRLLFCYLSTLEIRLFTPTFGDRSFTVDASRDYLVITALHYVTFVPDRWPLPPTVVTLILNTLLRFIRFSLLMVPIYEFLFFHLHRFTITLI